VAENSETYWQRNRNMSKATIVLAGGLSQRLGQSKPFFRLLGEPLLWHTITQVQKFSDETVVAIGGNDSIEKYLSFLNDKVRIAKDDSEYRSPLVGILTGLRFVRSAYTMIVACDLPFLSQHVAFHLFDTAMNCDAVVPKWPNGYIEPLHSVYNVAKTKLATERTLQNGELRVSNMIDRLDNVTYVDVEELRKFDRDLLTFFNINTKEDLKKAEEMLKVCQV
jgi:molybdopterin-guanine dinucleotide biosynthesis protein A